MPQADKDMGHHDTCWQSTVNQGWAGALLAPLYAHMVNSYLRFTTCP
jgi:hypothetical protein